jgi:hypothetical protein
MSFDGIQEFTLANFLVMWRLSPGCCRLLPSYTTDTGFCAKSQGLRASDAWLSIPALFLLSCGTLDKVTLLYLC